MIVAWLRFIDCFARLRPSGERKQLLKE